MPDIIETPFTEALLDELESSSQPRDIDDLYEDFLFSAAHHHNPFLMYGPQPNEDDILPF